MRVCPKVFIYYRPISLYSLLIITVVSILAGYNHVSNLLAYRQSRHKTTSLYPAVQFPAPSPRASFRGCMSLMFPTIYGFGLTGLGEDTKIGGSFMVMAIAGAAVLTQIQGIVSDHSGSIMTAYIVPAVAFAVVAYYGYFIARKQELATK